MENVNNSYFDGYYKDIWRSVVPPEFTAKEVDFIVSYFHLLPQSRVLDIMCGYGRHATGLAKKGIQATAVDNLDEYVNEIKSIAQNDNLPLNAVQADILNYEADGMFDLALCMGNSLCFFDRNNTLTILKMLSRHLKPGTYFFINTWTIAEIAFNGFKAKASGNFGDLEFTTESTYLLKPSRIETDHLIIAPDGKKETKKAIDYIYSISETEQLLNEAGFSMNEVYSIPGKKKFTLGDPRAYIVAQKR